MAFRRLVRLSLRPRPPVSPRLRAAVARAAPPRSSPPTSSSRPRPRPSERATLGVAATVIGRGRDRAVEGDVRPRPPAHGARPRRRAVRRPRHRDVALPARDGSTQTLVLVDGVAAEQPVLRRHGPLGRLARRTWSGSRSCAVRSRRSTGPRRSAASSRSSREEAGGRGSQRAARRFALGNRGCEGSPRRNTILRRGLVGNLRLSKDSFLGRPAERVFRGHDPLGRPDGGARRRHLRWASPSAARRAGPGVPSDGPRRRPSARRRTTRRRSRFPLVFALSEESLARRLGALRARQAELRGPGQLLRLVHDGRAARGRRVAATGTFGAHRVAAGVDYERTEVFNESTFGVALDGETTHTFALFAEDRHRPRRRAARRDGGRPLGRPQRVRERRQPARHGRLARGALDEAARRGRLGVPRAVHSGELYYPFSGNPRPPARASTGWRARDSSRRSPRASSARSRASGTTSAT